MSDTTDEIMEARNREEYDGPACFIHGPIAEHPCPHCEADNETDNAEEGR